MQYAPILIPTLNRDGHLKRCLDSLAANSLAGETEIYISVDYPPADKYREGYKKVCKLLEEYDFSAFSNHHILYQDKNLGPAANSDFLVKTASAFTDTVIYTEDDNEFSPNFLYYINKGFEEFNDDKDVVFLCGSSDAEWYCPQEANVMKGKLLSAYGLGYWISRKKRFVEDGNTYLLCRKNWTIRNFRSLYKKNKVLFWIYVSGVLCSEKGINWEDKDHIRFCDSPISIYMHFSDYVCICPLVSKSRTFGNDGSGVNMPAMSSNSSAILDESDTFDYKYPEGFGFYSENYRIGDKMMFREMNKIINLRFKLFTSWLLAIYLSVTKNRSLPLFIRRLFSHS